MNLDQLHLGGYYLDPISGWKGVATGRYDYLHGCTRVELAATDKDKKPESFVFDFQQLVPATMPPEIKANLQPTTTVNISPPAAVGGPRDNRPVRR